MTTNTLVIETSRVDDLCKQVMRKLVYAGFNQAGINYEIQASDISVNEFSYLQKNGAVQNSNGQEIMPKSVVRRFSFARGGPEVGKIGFMLNFDLE